MANWLKKRSFLQQALSQIPWSSICYDFASLNKVRYNIYLFLALNCPSKQQILSKIKTVLNSNGKLDAWKTRSGGKFVWNNHSRLWVNQSKKLLTIHGKLHGLPCLFGNFVLLLRVVAQHFHLALVQTLVVLGYGVKHQTRLVLGETDTILLEKELTLLEHFNTINE